MGPIADSEVERKREFVTLHEIEPQFLCRLAHGVFTILAEPFRPEEMLMFLCLYIRTSQFTHFGCQDCSYIMLFAPLRLECNASAN